MKDITTTKGTGVWQKQSAVQEVEEAWQENIWRAHFQHPNGRPRRRRHPGRGHPGGREHPGRGHPGQWHPGWGHPGWGFQGQPRRNPGWVVCLPQFKRFIWAVGVTLGFLFMGQNQSRLYLIRICCLEKKMSNLKCVLISSSEINANKTIISCTVTCCV